MRAQREDTGDAGIDQTPEVDAEEAAPAEGEAPAAAPPQPAPAAPDQATGATAPPAAPVEQPAGPDQSLQPQGGAPVALTPQEEVMQRTLHDRAFANDLDNGHVHPKTISDLYNSKDTLGKIGTLFGLLVSGAGSGLTHQPNAVLSMMNQEIERDYDAQKQNQSNRMNWARMALEQQKQLPENAFRRAQIQELGTNIVGKQIANYGAGVKADYDKWVNGQADVVDNSAATVAKNAMLSTVPHYLQSNIDKMSPGPAKDRAQAALDSQVKPAVQMQQLNNNAQHIVTKKQTEQNAPNPENAPIDPNPLDQQQFLARSNLNKVAPQASKALPEAVQSKVLQEATTLQKNRETALAFDRNFKELATMKNAGQIPYGKTVTGVLPTALTAIGAGIGGLLGMAGAGAGGAAGNVVGNVAGHSLKELESQYEVERNRRLEQMRQVIGASGTMNADEREKYLEAVFPRWSDTEAQKADAYRKGIEHFKNLDVAPTMEAYGLKKSFPKFIYLPKKEPEESDASKSAPAKGAKMSASELINSLSPPGVK